MQGLLNPDPSKRMRIDEVLTHPWIVNSMNALYA